MTRSITALWTAALCAIAVAVAQPAASANGQTTSAQPKAPAKTSAPVKTGTPAKTSAPAKASTAAKTSTPATTIAPAAQRASAASLTGCLHADDDKFILSDLEGTQAPKGRSWKTGYIVKTGKDVEVVGTSSTVKLGDHIGHKITVTGTRDGERHFKAQSVKQVSLLCS